MTTVDLSDETQALLDAQMKRGGFTSKDEALRFALKTLEEVSGGEFYEDLDPETRQLIDEAQASFDRGEARPWSEVRDELRAKYIDRTGRP